MNEKIRKALQREDIVIGIDPDVTKSGFAVYDRIEHKFVEIASLSFPALVERLQHYAMINMTRQQTCKVYCEGGWLNASNWHIGYKDTARIAASKGVAVGRNQETGRKIIEMAEHYGIDVEAVKPLRKYWHGKDGKITHEELEHVTHCKIGRCSQDARDAALISFVYGK